MPQIHELPESLYPDEQDKFMIETAEGVAKYIQQNALFGGLIMQNDSISRNLKYYPDYTTYTNQTFSTKGILDIYVHNNNIYCATDGAGIYYSTDGGTTWTNRTTANGLGSNTCYDIYVTEGLIFVATQAGLSISTDGGASFSNKTTSNGLPTNLCNCVDYSGTTLYVGTGNGFAISYDGGTSFTTKTVTNGLGSNDVTAVYSAGGNIYACCDYASPSVAGGVSISTDGGTSFTNNNSVIGVVWHDIIVFNNIIYTANESGFEYSSDGGVIYTRRTTTDGLGSNVCYGLAVISGIIAVATGGGVSISTDGGTSFTNYTTADGLGSNTIVSIYNNGKYIYAGEGSGSAAGTLSRSDTTWKRITTGTGSVIELDIVDNAVDIYTTGSGAAGSTATMTKQIGIGQNGVEVEDIIEMMVAGVGKVVQAVQSDGSIRIYTNAYNDVGAIKQQTTGNSFVHEINVAATGGKFYSFSGSAGDTIALTGPNFYYTQNVLRIGHNRTAAGDTSYRFYSDGAAGTTESAQITRKSGANGALDIANRGTGNINVYVNNLATLALSILSTGDISLPSGTVITENSIALGGYLVSGTPIRIKAVEAGFGGATSITAAHGLSSPVTNNKILGLMVSNDAGTIQWVPDHGSGTAVAAGYIDDTNVYAEGYAASLGNAKWLIFYID